MSKYVGLVPSPELLRNLGVSDRTGLNWEARGILPKPQRINGRKYFPVGTLPKFDDMPRKYFPIGTVPKFDDTPDLLTVIA